MYAIISKLESIESKLNQPSYRGFYDEAEKIGEFFDGEFFEQRNVIS